MNTARATVRLYWQHAWRYPAYVIGLFISIPATIVVGQVLPPIIMASVLNRLSHHSFDNHIWASFGGSLLAYGLLSLTSGVVLWRIVDYFCWKLEAKVERDLARHIFDHVLAQSANFHANHFGGSLVSQTNKVLGAYVRMADTTIFMVLPLFINLVAVAVVLARRAPLFVVVLMAFAVTYIVSSVFVTRKVRHLTSEQAAIESQQTGYLADNITNVMAVKSFAQTSSEKRAFSKLTSRTHDQTLAVMRAHARQQSYFSAMTSLISALSLTMAVISIVSFHANIATAFLILSYTNNIVGQLFSFSNNSLRNYNRAVGDASDMVKILQLTPEVLDPEKPEPVRIKKGVIAFTDVNFQHDGADDGLFNNFDLEIASGEKIGLVGHSGSGKSTLTRLLLRFSDINSGAITIDGQNIAHITQDDLRRYIAYVPQEPLLFHRSIRENIAYGRPQASEADIVAAARQANADEFIEQLPQSYDTMVGERGVKLSGGQRQRIAIARAILKDAPILVLDEATSALDSESEGLIQQALQKLMQNRTTIVIAHRLSTIQKMDRIIVLQNGQIIEQGPHANLIAQKGAYAQMWAHQSGGFIEE